MDLRAILFAGLVFTVAAHADGSSCVPEFTSLQTLQMVDFSSGGSGVFPLKSENATGVFVSKARMSYTFAPSTHELRLRFHFDESFEGVSLPFNLYSVLVLHNGAVAGWYDFTHACKGIGPGFYPGQSFSPPPMKLEGEGMQSLQFMVWGRIN